MFALGVLTMAFVQWLTAQGIPPDFRSVLVPLLFLGPLVYLAGSFLVGGLATLEAGAGADGGGNRESRDGGSEGSADRAE